MNSKVLGSTFTVYRARMLRLILTIVLVLNIITAEPVQSKSASLVKSAPSELPLCTYFIGFNIAESPYDDILVRKALVAAVDRQVFPTWLEEPALPAMTFTPPGVFGHVDGFSEGIGIPHDIAQAQQWLSDAGYPGGMGFPDLELHFPWLETFKYLDSMETIQAIGISPYLPGVLIRDSGTTNQDFNLISETTLFQCLYNLSHDYHGSSQ